MNPPLKSKPTILLTVVILFLLIGIPFVNRYIPYTDTFNDQKDVWEVNLKDDIEYSSRLRAILIGFLLTLFGFVILIISIVRNRSNALLNLLLFLLIFSIGTKNYPYWINGLNNAKFEADGGWYDPKALLPDTITFGTWSSMIAIFYFATFVMIIKSLIFLISNFKNKDRRTDLFVNCFVTALLIFSFFLTPNYLSWLAD